MTVVCVVTQLITTYSRSARRCAADCGEYRQASRRRSRLKKEAPTDDVEASNVRLIRLTIRGQSADGVRREIIRSTFDAKTMASSIKALRSSELSEFSTGSKGTAYEQTGAADCAEYRQAAGTGISEASSNSALRRLAGPSPRPISPIIVPVGATAAVMPVMMMMPVMIVRGLRGRTGSHGH